MNIPKAPTKDCMKGCWNVLTTPSIPTDSWKFAYLSNHIYEKIEGYKKGLTYLLTRDPNTADPTKMNIIIA